MKCLIVILKTYHFFIEKSLPWCLEWLNFLHLKRKRYISKPAVYCNLIDCYDRARLHNSEYALSKETGQHAFCDVDGNSLKLSDIDDGMYVKIRAKNVRWHGYEYLYTADGTWGEYF